jgi:xylan 1,4-beta-xylosidase
MRRLATLVLIATSFAAAAQSPVSINIDLHHTLGDYKPITAWFGYDESNYTTTPNGRALLHELHDAYPVPVTIRAHHLLTSGNGVPELKWSSTNVYTLDADGKPHYDFTILDHIFDAFRDAHVRPMVEFGFMPEALASGPAPYQTHYPKSLNGSSQSPPKDYAAWGELCRAVTAHLVARYGKAEAATWYWEIWNEPNIDYWHGTEADYNKLYDFAVAGIRSALPQARVGGPATTSPRSPQAANFLTTFLQHVANDKSLADGRAIPLDFISFHIKGQPKVIPATAQQPEHVEMGLDKELTDADKGFAVIASFPQFKSLPIILSEADPEGCAACSAREVPSNNYRNGPLYPVYTAAVMKALFDLQDRHHVNLISMLTWSFEFEGKDFFQGFRTLSTNGIDKPILNVFRMAGMMSGVHGAERVATTSSAALPLDTLIASGAHTAPDIDAMATTDAHSAYILVWNYQDDDLPSPPATIVLKIAGLPTTAHRVHVTHFRIDATHSNAYTVWKSMGSPQQPTAAQLTTLQRAGKLEELTPPATVHVTNGTITLPFDLPRQGTSLLRITWD